MQLIILMVVYIVLVTFYSIAIIVYFYNLLMSLTNQSLKAQSTLKCCLVALGTLRKCITYKKTINTMTRIIKIEVLCSITSQSSTAACYKLQWSACPRRQNTVYTDRITDTILSLFLLCVCSAVCSLCPFVPCHSVCFNTSYLLIYPFLSTVFV